MSKDQMIHDRKDEDYRDSRSPRGTRTPAHPEGLVGLADDEMRQAVGGSGVISADRRYVQPAEKVYPVGDLVIPILSMG